MFAWYLRVRGDILKIAMHFDLDRSFRFTFLSSLERTVFRLFGAALWGHNQVMLEFGMQ